MAVQDSKQSTHIQLSHTSPCDRLNILSNINTVTFILEGFHIDTLGFTQNAITYIKINKELICKVSSVFKTMVDECKDNEIKLENIDLDLFEWMISYVVYGSKCDCTNNSIHKLRNYDDLTQYMKLYGMCYKYDINAKIMEKDIYDKLVIMTTKTSVDIDTYIKLYLSLPDNKIYQIYRDYMFRFIRNMYIAMIYTKLGVSCRSDACREGYKYLGIVFSYKIKDYRNHTRLFDILPVKDKLLLQKYLLDDTGML